MSLQIDTISRAILEELYQNARISYRELGRRVGLSTPAVTERVRRLEEGGIIRAYRAEAGPQKLGYTLSTFVRVEVSGSQLAKLVEVLKSTPEVLEAFRTTGEACYLARIAVRDVEHLQTVVDRLAFYGNTNTSLIVSVPVVQRLPV